MNIRLMTTRSAALAAILTGATLTSAALAQTPTSDAPKATAKEGNIARCERLSGPERHACERKVGANTDANTATRSSTESRPSAESRSSPERDRTRLSQHDRDRPTSPPSTNRDPNNSTDAASTAVPRTDSSDQRARGADETRSSPSTTSSESSSESMSDTPTKEDRARSRPQEDRDTDTRSPP